MNPVAAALSVVNIQSVLANCHSGKALFLLVYLQLVPLELPAILFGSALSDSMLNGLALFASTQNNDSMAVERSNQ